MTYSEWQKKYGKKIADNKTSATNSAKEIAEKAEKWHKKYNPPKSVSTPTKTPLNTVADATGGVFAGSSPEKKLADAKTALTGINGISRDSIVKANPTTYVNNTGRVLTRNDGGTAESRTAEAKQRLAAVKEANEKRQKENERLLAIDIDAYKNRAAEMKAERERLQKQLYPVVEDKMHPVFATKENKQDIQRRITSLNKQIGNIEADIYNAEKVNRLTGYNDLPKNEDYAAKSMFDGTDAYTGDKDKYVVASYLQLNPDQYKSSILHDYINGSQYAIDAVNEYDAEVRRKSGNAGEFLRKYRMMTNDEKSRYNYLYNNKRYDEADQYLSDIEGDLNARLGQDIANGLNDVQRVALGFGAGVENFVEGTAQLFTDKVKPVSVKQNAGQAAREHLGNVGQFAYDFAQLAGNMAPSILLSSVTGVAGAALGSLSMGASAAGNAYAEMMRQTGNKHNAMAYATLVGASESALSYALSGISKLGGKAINATKLAKNIAAIDNIWARTAAQFAKSGISEGFEETLQEYLEPLFYSSIYGGDYEAPEVKDALRTFALAALSGGVFEGPSIVAGAAVDSAKKTADIDNVYKKMYTSDNGMLELLISDSVAGNNGKKAQNIATALQEKINSGKEVSGADIRKLATPAAKHNKNLVTAENLEKYKAATANMLDSYIAKHRDSKKPKTGLETAKQEMERKTEGVRRADADTMLKNPYAIEALKEYGYDPAAKDKVASVRTAIKKMASENVTGEMAVDSAITRYTKEVAADSVSVKAEPTEMTADTAETNVPTEAKFEPNMNTEENTEVIDNAEGNLHLRYGSERNDGANPSVQVRSMEESAGRDSGGEEIRSGPRDEEAANVTPVKKVKGSAVIEGGIDNDLYLYEYTATKHTRKAKEYADARGLKLVLFGGDSLKVMQDDRIVSAKGAIRGDTIYVRVDHPDFTADQIALHEITHDKINKGEISVKDVRDRINDLLDPAEVEQLIDMYIEAYHGSKSDEMRIFAEIICDAEAGLNEFVGTLKEESARKLLENTRIATEENIEERRTRGPPAESKTEFSESADKTSVAKKRNLAFEDSAENPYTGKSMVNDPQIYSWDFLTSLPDMKKITLPNLNLLKNKDGKIDTALVVKEGIKNARTVGTERAGITFVRNRYTQKPLRITSNSIRHGLNGSPFRLYTNARLGYVIGEIVQNAVPINALKNKAQDVSGTYSMAAYSVDENGKDYVAVVTIEQRTGVVESIEAYDMLHAVSGRQNKSSQADTKSQSNRSIKATEVSIADFLSIVKNTHQSILSEDVLSHFGETRNENGAYSNQTLFSEELDIETRKEHNQIAIDHFGKTNKWDETGYILLDGSRLDFSGRHDGAPGGYRTVDHRDIRDALGEDYGGDDYSGGMVQFMSEGNIRVMPESDGLNLSVMPTKEQERAIDMFVTRKRGEVILDLDDTNGNTLSSIEYPRGTSASRVIADIHRFFEEGSAPRVSSVAMFHDADFSEELTTLSDLRKDNERLRKQLAHWRNEVKTTDKPTVRRDDVEKLSRRLVRDYHLTVSAEEVTNIVEPLANLLAKNEDVTWNQVRKIVEPAARQMIESAEVLNDESWNEYRDLREFIKKQKIVMSPAEASSIADFNAWKKLNGKIFGGISLGESNVDSIYDELTSKWGEFFNAESEKTDSDRMLHIVEVMNRLTPIYENPYDFNISAATEYLADDIMDSMISPDIRRVKTYADRANEKLKAAKQKRIDDLRKKTQSANARAMRDRIIRHSSKLYQDLGTIRKDRNIPEELRAPVAAVLDAINFESKHTVVEDENGRRHVAPEGVVGDPTKRTTKFAALKAAYQKLAGSISIDPNIIGMGDQPGILDNVISMADVRIDDMNARQLEDVWSVIRSMEQAITTWNKAFRAGKAETISEVADHIYAENAFKKSRDEFKHGGFHKLLEVDNLTPEAYFHRIGKVGDSLFRMLRNAQDEQIRILAETTEFAHKAIKESVGKEGIRKLDRSIVTVRLGNKDVKMTASQLMELYALTRRPHALMHILTGGIRLDSMDIGKNRLLGRSDVIRNITEDELNKAFGKLTEGQKKLADILQDYSSTKMSAYGNRASMEVYGVKKFTEEYYWPIRTHTNDTKRDQETAKVKASSVANKGITIQVKPDAKTSLRIGSLFDTFANHSVEMSAYSAFLAPMEDLNRIRNYKFHGIEDVASVGDLLNLAVGRGNQGADYLATLMEDLSVGVAAKDTDINPMSQLIGNYKAASVGANVRVIMQQWTAGLRAFDMVDPKYFASKSTPNKGWEKALKYAPIAQWKDWGYFDVHTGRQIKDVMFDSDSALDKAKQIGMWGAGAMDSMTWGVLWNACENEVADKHKDIKRGTDAFYKKVAERFNEVIDHTQVVDGILQRSQIMRTPGTYTKLATAFLAEPTKQINMVMSAVSDYRNARTKDKKAEAGKKLRRTALSLCIAGIVNGTLGTALIDGLRDDDDEKNYWEKILSAMTGLSGDEKTVGDYVKSLANGNVLEQFNPLGMIPYVKDVWSTIQGYTGKSLDDAALNDIVTAVNTLVGVLKGDGKKSATNASLDLAGAIATAFGLPIKNVKRDVLALTQTIINGTENSLVKYRYAKLMMNPSENKKAFFAMMYDAYKNDKDAYEIIRKDLLREGFTEEDLDGGIKSGVKTAFNLSGYVEDKAKKNNYLYSELEKLGGGKASNVMPDDMSPVITYKDDKDKEITVQLDEKEYAKFQKDVGDKAFDILKNTVGGAKWKSMTDDEKKSAISYAYQIARAYGKQNASGYEADDKWLVKALEKAERADEIVTYKAMRMSYDKNNDGKLNATERNAAINAIAKTEEEKRLLRMLS